MSGVQYVIDSRSSLFQQAEAVNRRFGTRVPGLVGRCGTDERYLPKSSHVGSSQGARSLSGNASSRASALRPRRCTGCPIQQWPRGRHVQEHLDGEQPGLPAPLARTPNMVRGWRADGRGPGIPGSPPRRPTKVRVPDAWESRLVTSRDGSDHPRQLSRPLRPPPAQAGRRAPQAARSHRPPSEPLRSITTTVSPVLTEPVLTSQEWGFCPAAGRNQSDASATEATPRRT